MPTNGTGYITRTEAADRAGVHVRTIDRWIAEGHITRHAGRRGLRAIVLIDSNQLDKLITPTVVQP